MTASSDDMTVTLARGARVAGVKPNDFTISCLGKVSGRSPVRRHCCDSTTNGPKQPCSADPGRPSPTANKTNQKHAQLMAWASTPASHLGSSVLGSSGQARAFRAASARFINDPRIFGKRNQVCPPCEGRDGVKELTTDGALAHTILSTRRMPSSIRTEKRGLRIWGQMFGMRRCPLILRAPAQRHIPRRGEWERGASEIGSTACSLWSNASNPTLR